MENPSLTKNKSNSKDIIFTILRKKSYLKLLKKYSSNIFSYNTICINNIIYNESCLIVAKFKDYLIYDDNSEFLRKLYTKTEINVKLLKILDLYENYSKIFPNYLVVKEKKFMYKNIRRKQKMIDAFNQIKLEEEENRRKIKEKREKNEIDDNRLFTDLVKDEIKIFQKKNNIKKYKNSFDSDNEKDKTDSLNGLSQCSISINLINKNKISSPDKGFSIDCKNNETNGTISGLLNIMNDSKIYIKDLPNLFKVNYQKDVKIKNNIIEKKIISFKKLKNKNNIIKEIKKENRNISNNNSNNIDLPKINSTPEKRKKEINNKNKNNNFHFNSTLLTKKRVKILNPTLVNSYSSSINKEKILPKKQKIYFPSIGNTIININNNFFSEISKTERFAPKNLKKLSSLNTLNTYNTIENSSKENEKENKIKNNKFLLLTNHNYKPFSQDFSYKKNSTIEVNNKIYKNKVIINEKRELTPKLCQKSNKIKYQTNINSININNIADKQIRKDEFVKININQKIQKSKEKKENKKSGKEKNKNKGNSAKNNNKLFSLKYKPKPIYNNYTLFNFLNITKTDSNINEKVRNQNIKKNNNLLKKKQKTCFNFLNNKNIKKDITLQNNIFLNHTDKLSKEKEFNQSYKSLEKIKSKNYTKIDSIKNKILTSEKKVPYKKYISNYINKTKDNNIIGKTNNCIDYSTFSAKNQINKNIKNILSDSRSIEKKKKCESIDFSNSDFSKHKNMFSKIDSTKRNSYIFSPKNTFTNFINSKNKKSNIFNDYFTEKTFLFNQTIIPKQKMRSTISQNDIRNKYKSIILTKNNKKSYDFNSNIQNRYNRNFMNKINNLKNTSKNYNLPNIKKNSYSIDLNILNYNNKTNCYICKNKSKEKDKKNNSKDLFKKIMNFNNEDRNKKEENNNNISSNKCNNIPLTIRVNTSNFLTKIREKYKITDKKNK